MVIELSALLAAIVGALVLTPVAARMRGFSAAETETRWHTGKIPATGGIALCGGLLAGVGAAWAFGGGSRDELVLVVGAVLAFLLGLRDDARPFRPAVKLFGQVAIAVGGAVAGLAPGWAPAWIGVPVAAFVLVAAMNSVNLLDNIDGLAAGTSAAAAAGVIAAGSIALGHAPLGAIALCGACLGFLPFNYRPGRKALLFMGDSGSHLLGFALGGSVLLVAGSGSFSIGRSLIVPVLLVSVPVLDTSLVMVVRKLEGRPLSVGGRDHLSHRLVYRGLSDWAAVALLVAVSASSAAIACALLRLGSDAAAAGIALVVAAALGLAAVRLVRSSPRVPTVAPPAKASLPISNANVISNF
jgi:UDP-GlcNAc:undecaprenyl-phosphate/decaprenyl-phosphate GlcNAc-1-phosphate transferase